jgi:hypothetical protein
MVRPIAKIAKKITFKNVDHIIEANTSTSLLVSSLEEILDFMMLISSEDAPLLID